MIENYRRQMNREPLGAEAYLGAIPQEAFLSDLEEEKEWESFHFEYCFICSYQHREECTLKSVEEMNDEEKILYDVLMTYRKNNPLPPKRKLVPFRGKFIWYLICEKCNKPHDKNINKNNDDAKRQVQEWLK